MLRRILIAVLVIIVIAAAGFVIWASSTNPLMPEAVAALEGNAAVAVDDADYLSFSPVDAQPTAGLILYPGGRVQAGAYAPLALSVAENGYYSAIVYAPLNLAFFNVNAAQAVIDAHPEIDTWVVGGHSLGGVAASLFAESNDAVDGLVLMASYPANGNLASRTDLSVVSIYGTQDGLASEASVQESASSLPAATDFVLIEGGNHAQFGYYGEQDGDNPATISRADQQAQTVDAILELFSQLTGTTPGDS